MKKTYIIPEALTICLSATLPVATSPDINVVTDDDASIGAGDVNTKESKNLWDINW